MYNAIVSLKSLCRGDYNISGKRCSLENTPTFLSVVQPKMRVSLRVIAQEMDIGTMACRERGLFCRKRCEVGTNGKGVWENCFGLLKRHIKPCARILEKGVVCRLRLFFVRQKIELWLLKEYLQKSG